MNTTTTKSNRSLIALLGLACLALAGWSWKLNGDVSELQTEPTQLRQQLDAADKRAQTAAADAAKWHAEAEKLLAQSGGGDHSESAAGAAGQAKSEHKRNFNPDEVTAMVKNPGLQNLFASQATAVIKMTYGDLISRLNLSPEESDYFQKLLLDKQMVQQNLGMQMMNPTLTADERAALRQQIIQGMTDDDSKIQDFLNSSDDYAYYQTYSQQEPERMEVGMFESSLGGDDTLDPATSDALATLMNSTRQSYPFTVDFYNHSNFGNPALLNTATVSQFLDEQSKFQDQVAQKAADLLTPAQLQAFKQNQGAIRQMTKMQMSNIVQMVGGGQ
jgi:hypothetical protein